jgi:hypothetical protein
MQAAGLVLDNVQSTHVAGRIDVGARHHQPWGVTRLGDHRLRAHVDEQWTFLQGVHGGGVAAISERVVRSDSA